MNITFPFEEDLDICLSENLTLQRRYLKKKNLFITKVKKYLTMYINDEEFCFC